MDTIPQDTPQKQCSRCKQYKEATSKFFYRDSSKKDGLHTLCKVCAETPKPTPPPVPEGYKRCNKCEEVKPATIDFFPRHKTIANGLLNQCKECCSNYNKPYQKSYRIRPENQERQRTRNENYFALPEIRERKRAYDRDYITHPQNQERRRSYRKGYWQSICHDPQKREKIKASSRVIQHTRRSRKQFVSGTHTPEQIQEQLRRQKFRCYYAACGHSKFKKVKGKYIYHIEHTFPLSRVRGSDIPANDMSYIVLACPHCNMEKHDKYPWEWSDGGRLL